MTRRTIRRSLQGVALALVVAVCSTDPTPASADTPYTVPTKVEAWYHAAATPAGARPGLPTPPVSPYPAGTLHVAVSGGTEDARTYLSLDESSLPSGAHVTGGTLALPVDSSGSLNPETAAIDVCFAAQPGPAVAGSLDAPPAIDCAGSVRAVYEASTTTITVDLTPFVDRLRGGGLALVPSTAAETGAATWHVAFFGKGSTHPTPAAITATLEVRDTGSPTPAATRAIGAPTYAPPGSPHPGPIARSPAPIATPVAATPLAPAPVTDVGTLPNTTRVTPIARVARQGFRYSVIFLLPLALLLFAGYFATALTRDPAPRTR